MIFGIQGDFESFYSSEVNSDYKEYALFRYDPSGWTEIVPFTYVYRTINPGVMGNHLKVTRYGDTLTLEVNGTVLGTYFGETITRATGLGLIVSSYSDQEKAEARLDNFGVTGLESSSNSSASVLNNKIHQLLLFDQAASGSSFNDQIQRQVLVRRSWR